MTKYRLELFALMRLALPVALAQLAVMGMSATDVLIAGQAGTIDLAGMNLGANTWNMVILFFMGIGLATQPLVAKRFGAGDDEGVKHQLHQSIWLGLVLGLFGTAMVLLASWLLQFVRFEAQMLGVARDYLLVISLCALPMSLIPSVRGTLEGMNFTRVVFLVNGSAFLLNIPLDYVFVHGYFGFPKLGGVGCAWATVILVWSMFLVSALILKVHPLIRHRKLFSYFQSPSRNTIVRTLKLGLPIGFSIIIELSMFSGAGMLIAAFGSIEAGAHAVAITVAALSFMFYMGIGQGVTIRASQFLGADNPEAAWYTIKIGTAFNMAIAIFFCILFIVFTKPLILLFSNDPPVIELAVTLLYFGAAFQIADSLQIASISALRAYHDTASPPRYQVVAFLVFGLPLGVGLAFYNWWPGLEGAKGMWMAMVVSLFMVGVFLFRRLLVRSREIPQNSLD